MLHVLRETVLSFQASWPLFIGRSVACVRWFGPEAREWKGHGRASLKLSLHVGLHVPVCLQT